MNTKENSEILLDYASGKLNPAMASQFESHMKSCADCRAFSLAQKSTWDSLDTWDAAPVSADFDRKLYERINRHENSGWFNRLWYWVMWRPAFSGPVVPIATACVTLVVGAMLYLPVSKPIVNLQSPPSRMESSDLEQIETTLEDMEMFRQLAPLAAKS